MKIEFKFDQIDQCLSDHFLLFFKDQILHFYGQILHKFNDWLGTIFQLTTLFLCRIKLHKWL